MNFSGTRDRVSCVLTVFLGLLLVACTHRQGGGVEAGRKIAQENCSRCHAIGQAGESPLPEAPPLRRLHERYPVSDLAEALAEGIMVGHPEMPSFEFDQAQIDDLIAYLESLESVGQ